MAIMIGATITAVVMGALKVLLISLLNIVLSFVLFKVLIKFKIYMMEFIMDKLAPYIDQVLPGDNIVITFTGVAGYFADCLRLVEVFSIIVSAAILTFSISIIKRAGSA